MTDHEHPITFGVSADPSVAALAETRRLARLAEETGLDHLAVQDHPYQPTHLDALTLIGRLAAETTRLRFLTDVADLQLRPPVMLAKTAASLDALTGGRLTLGVGAGGIPDAINSMGGTGRTGNALVTYAESSLHTLRRALGGGPVLLENSRQPYAAGPPAPMPIWLGSQKPRMLALTGRLADGWISPLNIYVPPAEVPSRQRLIDEAAVAAGRDPRDVRRIYNVIGTIGAGRGGPGLNGDVRRWIDTLTAWSVELGFDTFIFWPATDPLRQVEKFATEVAPEVRR